MKSSEKVFLHVWSGSSEEGRKFAGRCYPGAEIISVSHRELRESGWKAQIRVLRRLKGKALIFFFESRDDIKQPQLLLWAHLLHHCVETVVADSSGHEDVYGLISCVRQLPKLLLSIAADSCTFAAAWVLLHLLRSARGADRLPVYTSERAEMDLAYLYPYPLNRSFSGGAMSHIRGVLGGLAQNFATCEIFSGCPLPVDESPVHVIAPRRRLFLFWESLMLLYNVRFARAVRRHLRLRRKRPRALYQRHGRFVVAGALLARWIQIPLILEYNGSEVWVERHWDPGRFRPWLALCEEVAVANATLLVVVSEALRQELLARGIPDSRILVNPNGVDPDFFQPGCGGRKVREQLGIRTDEVLVTFVGTFGPWHGVEILAEAIAGLLEEAPVKPTPSLRFLLVGQGILSRDVRKGLEKYAASRKVIFTGLVPHEKVREYLDASDILISPHLPMPDGRPFFGSPTKLFEYMAMAKAIVASRLGQLAEVLTHGETAWLVEPGNTAELAAAIQLLAHDSALRVRLGRNARSAAIGRHSWRQNASLLLEKLPTLGDSGDPSIPAAIGLSETRVSDTAELQSTHRP
jgi:glycosyltransferase involved in cell wall biosynthesis